MSRSRPRSTASGSTGSSASWPGAAGARRRRWSTGGRSGRRGGGPAGRQRVAAGQSLSSTSGELPAEPHRAGPLAVPVDVVYADADVLVVDKPPGLVVHPGAGQGGARSSTGCWPATPSWPASAKRTGPASCTGSTGTRPASWWWRDPDGVHGARRRAGGPPGRPALHGAGVGRARGAPRRDRRADRPLAPPAHPHGGGGGTAGRPAPATRCASAFDRPPTWPSWVAGSRPAGPTRSACTWRRSAIPSSATATTAARATASPAADVPARRATWPSTTRSPAARWPSTPRSRRTWPPSSPSLGPAFA